jgi:xanthine phosphoribosyltransferase
MPGGADRAEIRISKARLDRDIDMLADRVAAGGGPWRAVVGVANGGIYPAGRVADRLKLPYREVRIVGYEGRDKTAPKIVKTLDDASDGEGLIVVDDVVDSGDTALLIRQLLPRAELLVVYVKADGLRALETRNQAPVYAARYPQDRWIVFPWHQESWPAEVPHSVACYRAANGLDPRIPITPQ